MAFTIEEVEKALNTPAAEWRGFMPQKTDIRTGVNYTIITNYLTGVSNSLSGLQQAYENYSWFTIINLLHDIENTSTNEQLVLDVIYDPGMFSYLRNWLNQWLLAYATKHTTDKAFQAVLQHFRKQGMTDHDVFSLLMVSMRFGITEDLSQNKSAALNFIRNYIRQSPKLIPPYSHSHWNNNWSTTYLRLLEELRPDFAPVYIVESIQLQRSNQAAFFNTYQEGKYIPYIISFLTNGQNYNLQTIQAKFSFAIELYETDTSSYKQLVLEITKQYLSYFFVNTPKQTWEQSFNLSELAETELSYLPLSSIAFHFLLQYEKEFALKTINDWLEQKIMLHVSTLMVLEYHLKNDAFNFIEQSLKVVSSSGSVDYIRNVVELLQQKFNPSQFLPLVWGLVGSKSKPIRNLVAKVVAEKDATAESKAIALLQNKNAETRQTAAIILSYCNSPSAKEAIMKMLNTENNDNNRDILLQTIADNLPTAASLDFVQDVVAAAKSRGKLSKPVESWLDETTLPPLFYATGAALSIDEKRFLLYRMSRVKEMRSDIEARYLLQFIDKESSGDFASAIFKAYIDTGAKPEYKYIMALAALLGNDAVVDKIRITTNKWIEESRYKMAEYGVGALALQGNDKALRWVEWYSRKYKSKKANVGAAALVALETAAEELGITIHELGDRVVPDFGFDGLFKHFIVDGDEYRAFIDSKFKIAFFNEDNKKLKAIPAGADVALKEEFKGIAKEVRDIVKSQSSRLEYYLIIQRKWNKEQWEKFFLQNPVMFIYATKLLWGAYNSEGNLLQTFMCSEDTSLLDVANDEVTISDNSCIGIVHPSQLNETLLMQWKQVFFNASIDPIFPQLDRKMPDLKDIDLSKSTIKKFEGRQMQVGSIRSTLEKYGWHKGPTGDGGMLESFNLLYFEKKIEAIMEVEGVGAGFGWGMEEKLRRLYVIDKSKITSRWGAYIKDDTDEKLIPLKEVPSIFLSEMLAAVESIKPVEK